MKFKVCVSERGVVFEDEVRLVHVFSDRGANTVRYARDSEVSCRANGLVGEGDVGRGGRGTLAQNGSSVERREDIDMGAGWGSG